MGEATSEPKTLDTLPCRLEDPPKVVEGGSPFFEAARGRLWWRLPSLSLARRKASYNEPAWFR